MDKRIFIQGLNLEALNTSWPQQLEAFSCQALESEPQRIEVLIVESKKLKPLPVDPNLLRELPIDEDLNEDTRAIADRAFIKSK